VFRESRPGIDRVWIDHAPSFTTQIILRCHFLERSRRLVLGNTPQAKADGRQNMGRWLPLSSRCPIGREASLGRFPEWTSHGGRCELLFLILQLERNLQQRGTRAFAQKGVAVTFIVHASRGEEATTTIRLSVVVAIAKGLALAEEGWQVFITGPDGIRYYPSEFDKLLSLSSALRSPS
jgi:hypothetical protein